MDITIFESSETDFLFSIPAGVWHQSENVQQLQ